MRVLYFFTFFIMVNVHGASFDCSKASSTMEKVICENEEISQLDSVVGKKYKVLKNTFDDEELKGLIYEQKKWLKERNKCLTTNSEKCILQKYADRIFELDLRKDVSILECRKTSDWEYLATCIEAKAYDPHDDAGGHGGRDRASAGYTVLSKRKIDRIINEIRVLLSETGYIEHGYTTQEASFPKTFHLLEENKKWNEYQMHHCFFIQNLYHQGFKLQEKLRSCELNMNNQRLDYLVNLKSELLTIKSNKSLKKDK